MSQSLYTAMGGISAAQTQLNVISNNIANLNTTAFKSSSVNFSDVFSRTVSSGSVSTQSTGGTNPIQVGVGVQVSSISKDFNSGSWISTGKPTDLMIEGPGFFTVESSDGQKFYTRAGDFTFDEQGYLVTSGGYKLMGTDNILSSTTTDSNVYVPKSIIATKAGNAALGTQRVNNLNHCEAVTSGHFTIDTTVEDFTAGTFTLTSAGGTVPGSYTINLSAADVSGTLANLATAIQTDIGTAASTGITVGVSGSQITFTVDNGATKTLTFTGGTSNFVDKTNLDTSTLVGGVYTSKIVPAASYDIDLSAADVSGTVDDLLAAIRADIGTPAATGITVGCVDGQIVFSVDGVESLEFSNPTTGVAATNFITATGMNNATKINNAYSSNILDWTVAVSQVTSASLADSNPTCSISADGSIQATYSSGDTLSVQLDDTGTSYKFLYTTSDGIAISDTKCTVDPNVADEANFVIQMASITNTDGLLSVGSNLFKSGPNSGSILYSVGGKLGLGKIESGGLEASNVDLSKEFSNMIVAQRAVQANSRVFTTTSNIMDTIVSMGR